MNFPNCLIALACNQFKNQKNVLLILFLLLSTQGWTQLDSVHYFPPIHSRQNGQIAEQYVYLSTPEVTPFTVTLVDGGGNFLGSAVISKDNPENIFIGSGQFPGTAAAVPKDSLLQALESSGIIASGDYDFYCNVRVKSAYQATSVACKGRAALGKTFYAGSMPQAISNTNRNFITSIMAVENGTIVNVTGFNPGVEFESAGPAVGPDAMLIFLNAGETYVLSGYTTATLTNSDGFIGAKITSNKDIAVNTGNYMGSIHTEGFQDAGMVQIVPTNLLGTEHVVVEGGGGPIMERPLVVAIADGTEIFINDIVAPVTTIDEGEYYLVPNSYYSGGLHKNMAITTSIPAYVYQCTAATTSSATSEFNFIPPLACYLTDFIDAIPDIDKIGATTFDGILYVITTTGSVVTVNGTVLGGADGPEPAIGLPDWETYNLDMIGDVTVNSTGAMAAGFISVNGFAGAGAYYAGFTFDFQVDAGEDLDLCIGEEALFYGTGAGDDGVYVWDGGIMDSVAFTPDETMTYYVTGTNIEGCEDEDSVKVTVFELPTSNAGPDQFLCDTSATTLAGSAPLITGEGTWSMAFGPSLPIFSDETEFASEVEGLVEGTYQLVWSVSNGPCDAITDTVNIYVYDLPESESGDDQNLCDLYETTLEGNLPSGTATGLWSMLAGPSTPTFTDNTNPVTLVSDLEEGSYALIWTISNGTCPADEDTVFINVYDLPVSISGIDDSLCDTYSYSLNGNSPLGTTTGNWSMLSGPASPIFDDPTDSTATVSALIEGTYEFIWSLSNGSCDPVNDTVTIYVFDAPVSNAGTDQFLCDVTESNLNATTPEGSSTGQWVFVSGPSAPVITEITNPTSAINGLTLGTYVLVWEVSNGNCESVQDTLEVVNNPFPTVNLIANPVFGCAPLTVNFSNFSDPVGEDCLWEFGDGATETGCGDVFHVYGSGQFDVTLTVTSNGCTASETFIDLIEVLPEPEANFVPSPNVINVTNTTVEFQNNSNDAINYYWDFDNEGATSGEFEPTYTFPEIIDASYEVVLIVENEFGCADTTKKIIYFEDLLIFYIPNAFTPDASGMNDLFKPVITSRVNPYDYNMKIFNRWGELVYATYNYDIGWNGTYDGSLVQDGVYVWIIDFGDTNSDERFTYTGHVIVLK